MLAEIITIGDEILIGQIVDTNSAWIAPKLNELGIQVKQISSVSDDREHILQALKEAATRVNIILITGGLGPTKDDITKKTLCEYFGVGMVQNAAALQNVKEIFERFNRPLLDVNIQQADVPSNAEVLLNTAGTAPGMWFNEKGVIYISMPGVPGEMKNMMTHGVLPRLEQLPNLPQIVHQTILTAGLGESFLAKEIEDIENSLPEHIKLAYLPKYGQVRLRLSGKGKDKEVLQTEIMHHTQLIIDKLGKHVVMLGDDQVEQALINKLRAHKATLSLAESCTGGYIAHLLTTIPGASDVFKGSIVAYSNDIKTNMIGVNEATIHSYGAVSEQTVSEMAMNTFKKLGSTYAIACSGIAGPDGGTTDKPVGTVWIAIASAKGLMAREYKFGNNRLHTIERTANVALYSLLQML